MTAILGPMPCIRCGRKVWWDRVGSSYRLMAGLKAHACPGEAARVVASPLSPAFCRAWMPTVEDICARAVGHGGSHRRRLVMDDEAARRHGKRVAA